MLKLVIIGIIFAFILSNEGCQEMLSSVPVHEIKRKADKIISDAVAAYNESASEQQQSVEANTPSRQALTYGEQICQMAERDDRIRCLNDASQEIVDNLRQTLMEER